LDVHAETIAVSVAEIDGEVRSLGIIANRRRALHPSTAAQKGDDIYLRIG
jgi:hypothetical protein